MDADRCVFGFFAVCSGDVAPRSAVEWFLVLCEFYSISRRRFAILRLPFALLVVSLVSFPWSVGGRVYVSPIFGTLGISILMYSGAFPSRGRYISRIFAIRPMCSFRPRRDCSSDCISCFLDPFVVQVFVLFHVVDVLSGRYFFFACFFYICVDIRAC